MRYYDYKLAAGGFLSPLVGSQSLIVLQNQKREHKISVPNPQTEAGPGPVWNTVGRLISCRLQLSVGYLLNDRQFRFYFFTRSSRVASRRSACSVAL